MTEDILSKVRSVASMKNAIIGGVSLNRAESAVEVRLITDCAYSQSDFESAYSAVRGFVPDDFSLDLYISKLTPDCGMVKKKIVAVICEKFPAAAAAFSDKCVAVEKIEDGFEFTLKLLASKSKGEEIVRSVEETLEKSFCGVFLGILSDKTPDRDDIFDDESVPEEVFTVPVRTFPIENFKKIDGKSEPSYAIYIADFDFVSNETVCCGKVLDITEHSYTKQNGEEKPFFTIVLTDGTATLKATYFSRKRTVDKIRAIKEGDGIVCTCKSELYRGGLRYTAVDIDYGSPPENFKPERRKSKPVPAAYHTVRPVKFEDYTQTDLFTDTTVPDFFKGSSYVVFDLETTGLNTSSASGGIDGIIEISAYKVADGEICEKFSSLVNPERNVPLEPKIIELTGITDDMLKNAPSYRDVLPDFLKFCSGSVLVGHNVVGFDIKFVKYYLEQLGYDIDGPVVDTLTLSHKLLHLPNYKLNTIADYFGIEFNHHRAESDALATAKIFIKLVKLKKSLPEC